MKFMFKTNFKRDRYLQLTSIGDFENNVSNKKYNKSRYLIFLFLTSISGFILGYTSYYWKYYDLYDFLMNFVKFTSMFICFTFICKLVKDYLQGLLLPNSKENSIINIFNKFYKISTLQYISKVKRNDLLLSLILPIILFVLLPLILVGLGLENKILLALALSNLMLSTNDITQTIYLLKYNKSSILDLSQQHNISHKEINKETNKEANKGFYYEEDKTQDLNVNNVEKKIYEDELTTIVKKLRE